MQRGAMPAEMAQQLLLMTGLVGHNHVACFDIIKDFNSYMQLTTGTLTPRSASCSCFKPRQLEAYVINKPLAHDRAPPNSRG